MRLPDDLDWLYWPVMADPPLCSYADLRDGTLRLADVAEMNDALAAREENRRRAHEAARAEANRTRGG